MLNIEVVYAFAEQQCIIALQLAKGSSVQEAIEASGLLLRFPQLSLDQVGIFSTRVALSDTLREGDRVEIYRPLVIDPKEARRLRAAKKTR